ncbi:hypothetical protein Hanom_Chr03g00180761 [Helianthus anomalus]
MTRPDPTRPDPLRTDFFTYIPRGLKFLKMLRTPMKKFLDPPLISIISRRNNKRYILLLQIYKQTEQDCNSYDKIKTSINYAHSIYMYVCI